MDVLMNLITKNVAPATWSEGGGIGTIWSHGNLLCVRQNFQVHREVEAFLADLRAKHRATPTIVVDLHWLWLDGGQYKQLLGDAKPSSNGRSTLGVDAGALDKLGRTAPGFRGRIVCANGQLVHLTSGDRRSIIVNANPDGISYQPVAVVPNVGVVVELRPNVGPGGTTATIDVQSIVTRWGKPQATIHVGAAWPSKQVTTGTNKDAVNEETSVSPAGSSSCPVQRPVMPAQQFATTARVPLGKPVVLGGMTFAPADSAGMNNATDNPTQLYLIATTSIAADVSR